MTCKNSDLNSLVNYLIYLLIRLYSVFTYLRHLQTSEEIPVDKNIRRCKRKEKNEKN